MSDADTSEKLSRGDVPAWSVAIRRDARGAFAGGEFWLPCVLVIKRLSEHERPDEVKLNELVQPHGATL